MARIIVTSDAGDLETGITFNERVSAKTLEADDSAAGLIERLGSAVHEADEAGIEVPTHGPGTAPTDGESRRRQVRRVERTMARRDAAAEVDRRGD